MFPLWETVIAPVLRAARPARVVEIGALRGETTELMLDSLGAGTELHVIDPAPDFDPAEHEARFPGRYVFHRAPSLDVLPTLDGIDAALIDGDHNWYTVFNELRLIAEGAERAGTPLPVLVLHDVGWPYGRRDLYYAPERIPEEHRQPYVQRGLLPGNPGVVRRGGLNPTMWNAETEGGPRNGVMTAVDDFVAGFPRPLRVVVVPIYFGLAIVVDEARLAAHPAIGDALDAIERDMGGGELLRLSEQIRLRAMIFQHNVYFQRAEHLERAIERHLATVKASLLHEHYLEDEVRLADLVDALGDGPRPSVHALRDPVRHRQLAYQEVLRQRTGPAGPDDAAATSFAALAPMGRPQLDHLHRCLDAIRTGDVAGDVVDCGTARGGAAIFARTYLEAHEIAGRSVWVLDRFRASPDPELAPTLPPGGIAAFQADLNLVRDAFDRFGVLDDRVRFVQGDLPGAAAEVDADQVALLRVGRPARDDVRAVLDRLYDRVADGGFVVLDVGTGAARDAVEAFRAERGIAAPLEDVDASAVVWRRDVAAEGATPAPPATTQPSGAVVPLAPAAPDGTVELSVVVVVYNMKREAARTLRSLSRAYQEGIADLDYEVIVVENGSDDDEKLDQEFVAAFGPEFRYVDLGDAATPSPVPALNHGIRLGRGRSFALMIDGAHVLTPGVLAFARAGLATYSPTIVATQQWYVGPGQQGDAMEHGYDRDYEDRLFEQIGWPHDGYRLFEIGHFVDDRDWLDGVWESNCLFVDRKVLEQVGCFDERFTIAGGGYANLELYERLAAAPDVRVTTIIGEGSFHQLHGGTTTNQPDAEERRARVFGYGQEFAALKGRPFHGPGKQLHYVGRISTEAARRTRPRRLSAPAFAEAAAVDDGFPKTPVPVPDDLRLAFTEAVWRSLPWKGTRWLGRQVPAPPTDLFAYQELLHRVRPDHVVEIGTGTGGRALFLATICDLLGHGTVVSVDDKPRDGLPEHPRLTYVTGPAHDAATVARVEELVGDDPKAVVILGGRKSRSRTFRQFEAYAPLVPIGSYVVVADTILNGHPVWPAFGVGPAEAVKQILGRHGEFVADPSLEKYSLTFSPGGFLRRVREP